MKINKTLVIQPINAEFLSLKLVKQYKKVGKSIEVKRFAQEEEGRHSNITTTMFKYLYFSWK